MVTLSLVCSEIFERFMKKYLEREVKGLEGSKGIRGKKFPRRKVYK
jgi:hypothetical protein